MGGEERSAEEVDAVGDGGEDGVQAFADSPRLTGQVDDERLPADSRRLPREDGGGHFFERDFTHQLAEAGHHLLADGVGGFGPFYAVAAILTLAIGFPRFMLYKK